MSTDERGKLLRIGYDKLFFTDKLIGEDYEKNGLLGLAKVLSENPGLEDNERDNMKYLYGGLLATKGSIKESNPKEIFERREYERSHLDFLNDYRTKMKKCKSKFKEKVEETCKGNSDFDRVKNLSKPLPDLETLDLSFTSEKSVDDKDDDEDDDEEIDIKNIEEELKKAMTDLE